MQIKKDWDEYERVSAYVSELKRENARMSHAYRSSYDLEDIRTKALAMGLVPKSELKTIPVTVTVPEKEVPLARIEEVKLYLENMFAS